MQVTVHTTLSQELTVPDNWTRLDILKFLTAYQNFDKFIGINNLDQTAFIDNVSVIAETIEDTDNDNIDLNY